MANTFETHEWMTYLQTADLRVLGGVDRRDVPLHRQDDEDRGRKLGEWSTEKCLWNIFFICLHKTVDWWIAFYIDPRSYNIVGKGGTLELINRIERQIVKDLEKSIHSVNVHFALANLLIDMDRGGWVVWGVQLPSSSDLRGLKSRQGLK